MRIQLWLSMVLVLLAGGTALAQPPVCDADGPYSAWIYLPIQFDGTGSSSPGGKIVSYAWDFGDGTTGSGPTPQHAYNNFGTYIVTLTVVDSQLSSTCQTTAEIYGETGTPICDAGGPYQGASGESIQFDGSGSAAPGGTIDAYAWDFGDGATASGPTPQHVYQGIGIYMVSLTVTDNLGASSTCSTTATVYPDEGTPVCNAAGPYQGAIGESIHFDGSGSSMPGGFIVAYDWDFGDGATGTGERPQHAYVTGGTYTVTLTVTDDQSASSTCTSEAVITALPVEPTTWGRIKATYR